MDTSQFRLPSSVWNQFILYRNKVLNELKSEFKNQKEMLKQEPGRCPDFS